MKTQLCYDDIQQIASDFNALLTLPPLTDQQPFQIDDAWLTQFKHKARLPCINTYEGNRRLGFYYQWLWLQLIEAHPNYVLVADEIQLNWHQRTLGAIDFLVNNTQTNELEHWEVAIKFYLAYQGQWLGPNANDNLDKKTARMVEHQLNLTDHPAYLGALTDQYGAVTQKRLIMQGRLFHHYQGKETGSTIAIHPDATTGLWCFKHQANTLLDQGKQFRPLKKPQWISPPAFNDLSVPLDLTALTTPTQVVDQMNTIWFIVPDHWPLHNRDIEFKQ
ncbi:DUF1853 domain-containing protein [Photobacterium swingsii]|uniref:DUF1853 domain-containing protein n=1 Tax=Photobacterium swingsii TaxID=680026 RepID=A0A2T3PBU0_9GAMM|nr:DUF1853 family protein [Photobacterium swingsii]PSW26678.1 DUF1853 domain-containing protein [Photobacterium swingsii]